MEAKPNRPPVPPPAEARRSFLTHFLSAWTWRMAWRDSRSSRRKLLLFSGSIVLGIAALVAIGSLGKNVEQAIEEQAKTLLGADLVLGAQEKFSPEEEAWFKQLGGEQSREVSLTTMIYFPRTESSRLVQLRALTGGFPFYGRLETEPAAAEATFRGGSGGALVEETLLRQFNAQLGDSIRMGELTNQVAGRLQKVPGQTVALSAIAPGVYLSMDQMLRTGLLREGSLARYRIYFKFGPQVNVERLVESNRARIDKFRLGFDTVEKRKRDLGRSLENLYHFLNLVGFIALLLGGVGVASAIHVHIKQKLGTVAILRCLGGSIAQTFSIYLAQGTALGMIGVVIGGALGLLIQSLLPRVLADFIPFTFQFHTAWLAVFEAMGIGFFICVMFALLPLLTVRMVSPLAVIRASFEPQNVPPDPLRWLVGGCLAAGIVGFAVMQTQRWWIGLGFAAGLGAVFVVLAATAKGMVWLTRRIVTARTPFVIRQGVASLHRPNNPTLLLLLSLGLGTFLMTSLYLVQDTLMTQLISTKGTNQPNAVLFDIQAGQKEAARKLVQSLSLPVLDETPIITMRLTSVKGVAVESIMSKTNRSGDSPRWAYRREYRSTYSDHLRDGERLVSGQWIAQVPAATSPVPISLEEEIAKTLKVGLGDELVFDIQGIPMTTKVASLREVEWRRIQPNFFVVFPRGVLEEAPAMNVLVTRVASSEESARMQREVVKAFPNVSVIDLTLVLQSVNGILTKISFVIRFMAMFTVLTGLFVLVSTLLTSRYQRMQESVLLRTLGASRAQIFKILAVEYATIGLLSALTGVVLAVIAAMALAKFVFLTPFALQVAPVLAALFLVPAITVVTGLLMSRGVLNHPPLTVLRSE